MANTNEVELMPETEADPAIEVTPEMIAAGAEELRLSFDPFDGGMDPAEEVAENVFIAMVLASRCATRE